MVDILQNWHNWNFFLKRMIGPLQWLLSVMSRWLQSFFSQSWRNRSKECAVPTTWRQGSHDVNINDSLARTLPERLSCLSVHLEWSARSPNLAPCNYFLWVYLKSLVCTNQSKALGELKNNIRAVVANIDAGQSGARLPISTLPIDLLTWVKATFTMSLSKNEKNTFNVSLCKVKII